MTHPSTTQPGPQATPMWLRTPCTHPTPSRCSQIPNQRRWTNPRIQTLGRKETRSRMSSATSGRTWETRRKMRMRRSTPQQTSRTQHPSPSTRGGTLTQRTRTTHWTWTHWLLPQNQKGRSRHRRDPRTRRERQQRPWTKQRPPPRSWTPRDRTNPRRRRGKRGGRLRKWACTHGRKGRFHVVARVEFR